jgi:hypothetical protein
MMKTVFDCLRVFLTVFLILSVSVAPAANPIVPVVNGGFESWNGVTLKAKFGAASPTAWSIANGSSLTYLADPNGHVDGNQISVWPGLPPTSPAGGNFVLADCDTNYSSPISQTIFGLTPGQIYDLPMLQASGQEIQFTGATTEWWEVTFAGTTLPTPVMNTASHGFVPWHQVILTFTVPITSNGTEVLTFLAKGTPNGIPPIAFLDSVGILVPEPGSLLIVGVGLIVSAAFGRLRAKSAEV